MNLLSIDFGELFRRHLCRHSQFGLNVLHLISVFGVYFSLFGMVFALPAGQWLVLVGLSLYFAVLLFNVPTRVWAVTLMVVLGIMFACLSAPAIPWWVHTALVLLWHKSQVWSHKWYPAEADMAAFSSKYKKGKTLFILLAVYELPILLHYLLFFQRDQIEQPKAMT